MKLAIYATILVSLLLSSCNNEPSLQKYFVENADKKGFVSVDVSPSIINMDKTKLTSEQKTALESFDKMNILAYRLDENNKIEYDAESKKVAQILKGKDYQQLMKVNSGKDAASVSFIGNEDHINEFIFFAKKSDNGFAVVRVLGNDMNPNNIMNMISLLKSSNLDMEQLKPLQSLIK
jgi:hypothetical protein